MKIESKPIPGITPSQKYRRFFWPVIALLLVVLAAGLAWISSGFGGLELWPRFLAAGFLGTGLLAAGWWIVQSSENQALPAWMPWILASAAVLRLAAGGLFFVSLPVYGHGNPTEQAGYIMADAYERDQAAFELGRSDRSLLDAFRVYRKEDQYGGMLLLSALIYRFVGGETHAPLIMVVLTASLSALAVLLTWSFTRRVWDEKTARLAAFAVAIYPEAVLLGSSQMREAATIPLTMAAFYGLSLYVQGRSRVGGAWILAALALFLPFSPPFAALLLGLLALSAALLHFSSGPTRLRRQSRLWIILSILLILALVGAWLSWEQFSPSGATNPLAWWLKKSAEWQAYLTERASGKIQALFERLPQWSHTPFLLAYGVVQPFLPAAVISISQSIFWTVMAIWRALGWTILLPLLLYASVRAWSRRGDSWSKALSIAVWIAILVASFRGGGDLWDNPRYRATFLGLQIALAAWAVTSQQRNPDPLVRRVLVGAGLILAWFIPWYLYRKIGLAWSVTDLFKTIGLGLSTATLFFIWDWARKEPPQSSP